MKNRRLFTLILAFFLIAALFAGCGSKSYGNGTSKDEAMESPSGDYKDELIGITDSANTGSASTPSYQKKIRKLEMNAETDNMDTLLANVEARVNELGGYVEQKEVYRGSIHASRVYRHANLTLRVPAEQTDSFVEKVGEFSNITSTTEDVDDVTLQYVATESRILALETEQTRLLELLAKAENMEDLLLIESRLTEVRYELENVTSQLRVYDNLVNFATIHLYVNEVKEFTPTEEKTFWQRIGSGLSENLKDLAEGTENFVVFLITSLPYLILIAAVVTVLVLVLKSCRKKRKARKNAAKADPAE